MPVPYNSCVCYVSLSPFVFLPIPGLCNERMLRTRQLSREGAGKDASRGAKALGLV